MRDGGSGARGALLRAVLAQLEAGRVLGVDLAVPLAAAADRGDIEAALLHGLAIAARGEARRAAPLLHRVARARPEYAHPCCEVARLRPDAPSLVAAQFRASRMLAPNDPRLGYAYADFLLDGGDPAASATVLRQVLLAHPAFGPAHNLFGMALVELGDLAGAIEAFGRATALDPSEGATWTNLGMALKIESRFDEALLAYDRALACAPGDPRIRLNRAVALLRAGRMTEAWPDYEARMSIGARSSLPIERLLPAVDGLDLAGRTVLVWHEEGFGDTLQFARYIPLLAQRGARVVARMPPELTRLVATLDGVAEVIGGPELPPFDWHCPCFSLPRAFATTLDSIPAGPPYLRADPALAAAWGERLPRGGLRVGLVWAGQARPWLPGFVALDRRRSTTLAMLAPLARVPGVTLVSLQKGPHSVASVAAPRGMTIHDPMEAARDFADTAGIVANLDVVVSVDTAVVHLAAALGKPVLLLDRHDSCWRWLSARRDSPWYPTLRILRQTRGGDWAPVIRETTALLASMAAQRHTEAA